MRCPACSRKSCACYGVGWRDDWTLQAVHDRMLLARVQRKRHAEATLTAVYHFLVGRKPTRRQLREK